MSGTLTLPARIAVDAMGGDLGPAEVVAAVKLALEKIPGLDPIRLVGREEVLIPLLRNEGLEGHPLVSVTHASEVIDMADKPLQAIKRKKDSSMLRAIDLLKQGEARVLISCGNTGSLMAAGTLKLRTLEGVERPALATVMPTRTNRFVMIDAGANPQPSSDHMVHNAVMGSLYCRKVLGVEEPRVGLLTIGTEEGKGNDLVNSTHILLKSMQGLLNYHGLIEGFQVFENRVDVVVCDGFTGNVLLKTCEGLFKFLTGYLKDELLANPLRKTGAFLAQGAFRAMKRQLQPEQYGGAPLLGLRNLILKAHGSSNRIAIMHAMRIGHEIIQTDLNDHVLREIDRANQHLQQVV